MSRGAEGRKGWPGAGALILSVAALVAVPCAAQSPPETRAVSSPAAAPARPSPAPALTRLPDLGIEVVGVHITAGGSIVDFRYRVTDSAKAALLLDRGRKLRLLDASHGLALNVPVMPYVGPLRQTAVEPEAGKTYFILFGNAARSVKPGSKVTLLIGDSSVATLVVT